LKATKCLTHLLFFFFCPASSSSSGLKPEFLQARKPIFHNLLYFIYRWANPAETEIQKKNPSNMENWSFYNTFLSLFQWLD
jgi:hypothetical protein